MKLDHIPSLKTRSLTERMTIPVTLSLKQRILKLKAAGKDHNAWLRDLIDKGLVELGIR